MNKILKNRSLYKSYLAIALFVIAVMSLVFLFSTYYVFQQKSDQIYNTLELQADRLQRSYTQLIDFTSHEMTYIGRRIASKNADLEFTGRLLRTFRSQPNDILAWSTFSWANENHLILATNNFGVIEPLKDLSNRDYIPKTKAEPYKIHLGKAVYGLVSNQWVIPGGMGITNEEGEFIGSVVTGINIPKLEQELDKIIGSNEISFAIFDSDNKIVMKSYSFNKMAKHNGLANLIKSSEFKLSEEKGALGDGYAFYQKLDNYPYSIVVTQDKESSDRELSNFVVTRLIEVIAIIFIISSALVLLYKLVVVPLAKLSDVADAMSDGRMDSKIPRGGPQEVHLLAKQLLNLQRYIRRIQRTDYKLVRAKSEAEKANKAKSDFLAHMSHELRTPLNAIIGYSEIMVTESFGKINNEKYKEYIKDINLSGSHLLGLINDILDLSKAEANSFTINEDIFDVRETLQYCLNIVGEIANEKKQIIEQEIPNKLPMMRADELRIRQILLNIISNAIKFSPKGKRINISIYADEDGWILTIKDEGIGIEKKDIPKILEKFGQLNTPLARRSEGTGLGLWITRVLVEAHGGTLKIDSEVNVGTTVVVKLPKERSFYNI